VVLRSREPTLRTDALGSNPVWDGRTASAARTAEGEEHLGGDLETQDEEGVRLWQRSRTLRTRRWSKALESRAFEEGMAAVQRAGVVLESEVETAGGQGTQ
jgi:hypothetical protein